MYNDIRTSNAIFIIQKWAIIIIIQSHNNELTEQAVIEF